MSDQPYDGVHTHSALCNSLVWKCCCLFKAGSPASLLPRVLSPVAFLLALSNAGLAKSIHTATASRVPAPPSHPASQGNTALQQPAYRLKRTLGKPHSTQWSFRNTNITLVFPQSLQNVNFLVKHKPQTSARGNIHDLVYLWFLLLMPQYREWRSSFVYTEATLNDPRQWSYPHEVKRDTICFWLISPIVLLKIF